MYRRECSGILQNLFQSIQLIRNPFLQVFVPYPVSGLLKIIHFWDRSLSCIRLKRHILASFLISKYNRITKEQDFLCLYSLNLLSCPCRMVFLWLDFYQKCSSNIQPSLFLLSSQPVC